MSGKYGNANLAIPRKVQYLSVDATSDTVTLSAGTRAVRFQASSAMWIVISNPGETPTAAAPGAEKTLVDGFWMDSGDVADYAVPVSTDSSQGQIAAIQDTASGTLTVTELDI